MKKSCSVLIIGILLLGRYAMGQSFIPAISFGWGDYRMEELKELQSTITSPVQLKSISNFPPYIYYKASILYDIRKVQFGFSWGHYSTGARNHYEDYSGEISIKQLIHTDVFSLPFYFKFNNNNRLILSFMFEPGIMSTKYTILEEARLWDEKASNEFSDKLTTVSVQPGLKLAYAIKRWQPSIDFGYFFDTKFSVTTTGNGIRVFDDDTDYSDFSGIRLSISLAYRIGQGNP